MTTDNAVLGDILIVDDTPANLSVLSMMLTKAGYKVRPAISGEIALRAIEAELPDLILLDVRMPEMDGFELCQQLKAQPRTAKVPVIFISALSEIDDKLRAFEVGGVDYITKPFQTAEVRVRVNTHLTLARQRKEIEDLSQLKDQLLDTVTHNLKSPLSVILMYSEALAEGRGDSEDYAKKIHNAGDRMNKLISNFLDINKIESGVVLSETELVLQPFLNDAVMNLIFLAETKNIDTVLNMPDEPIILNTDTRYLNEAVENLLSNAIKYTPDGGKVDVTVKATSEAVSIAIADTGIGIPQEHQTQIFDKFYRVPETEHQQVSGTGLGLAIAHSIIEQLGGNLTVQSQEGEGSTFTITLPIERQ